MAWNIRGIENYTDKEVGCAHG